MERESVCERCWDLVLNHKKLLYFRVMRVFVDRGKKPPKEGKNALVVLSVLTHIIVLSVFTYITILSVLTHHCPKCVHTNHYQNMPTRERGFKCV